MIENISNKDLIVLSSAIHSSNVEVLSAKKKNIPIIPRAEMLSGISRGYQGIAVAGSHGKTTTTSLIAHIFNQALLSPTYVIGGKILSSDGNSRLGDGNFFIFEADERKTSNSKYDVCANCADPLGPEPSCYRLYRK